MSSENISVPQSNIIAPTDFKYGDSDICSKRRKCNADDTEDNGSIAFTECTPTNISPLDFSSVEVSSDFKGGLLNSTTSTLSAESSPISSITEQKSEKSLLITAKPSQTSKCFENTFKLLQTQLECNAKKAVSVMQSFNVDTSFLNSSSCSLPSISESEEPLTHLELELEAMRRVRTLVTNKTSYNISPRFVALLCDFVYKGQHKEDEKDYRENCSKDDEEDLRYHAAKNCDGKNCLRVIRTLCSEKVLCGNRVSQMTRAYDDIEAVTRLLEEKEKDLELTVQIGKELLTQNNALESRITELEADLKSSNEDRAQLVHELHKKNELIAVLTNDSDEGSENDTPTFSKSITLDLLQKKIATLQDENKSLKLEALQLASETDDVEAQERQLMEDITSQLNEANGRYDSMNLELERLREENRLQHEQIISLTARLSEAEMRLHQLTHDNDEHITLLNITKENQNSLAVELLEFKQRYQEVLALLQEAQEQLRNQRKKTMPQARSSFISNSGLLQPESLQSELMESSMYSENSLDSGISGDTQRADRMGRLMSQMPGIYGGGAGAAGSAYGFGGVGAVPPYKRVFETVRCASKTGNYMDSGNSSMTQLGAMAMSSSVGPRMSAMPYRGAAFDDNTMGLKTLSCESLASRSDDGYPAAPSGVPGAPGAKDLEAALKRLTPAEVLARRAMLSYAPVGTYSYDEQPTTTNTLPLGVRTPDSIMSTGSSGISSTNMSASMQQWRLPEKLQIVKPIEGSQTLHHWSRLATPTLSGLLEERPGVTIRGGRGLDDLGMQVYTLSDVEEDVSDDLPGKQFEASGCTFTYTTSMVMHPDDGLNDLSFLSQSQLSSRMASASTSRQPSCPPTPHGGLSRKNSCSTFSVNLGLASMLNERGIKAVTPSALNTPAGPNFTPTVTPCNSPEGSPPRSASPEPLFGILSTGADLIRRKLIGDIERPNRNQAQKQQKIMLSRLERRALRSLKLVEKVESIGLENIIVAQPNTMSQLASGIASRSSSPMAQLISLKNLHTCANNVVDDIHFDRDQIKTVLHKGLTTPTTISSCIRSDDESVETESISSVISTERTVKNGQQHIVINSTQNVIAATVTATPTNGTSTTESRIKQLQRQKSRRNLKNGIAGQRPDLGTINGNATGGGSGRVRPDLGKVSSGPSTSAAAKSNMTNAPTDVPQTKKSAHNKERGPREQQEGVLQTVVGTVSSLLFGRKGGWL